MVVVAQILRKLLLELAFNSLREENQKKVKLSIRELDRSITV
jgi:hypothetical protein